MYTQYGWGVQWTVHPFLRWFQQEISKSRERTLPWQRLADNQTLLITNQAEARKKEGPVLCYCCKWLFLWFETSAMWLQTSCQSHMKKHMKNVHEGLKYDCTSSDYNSGDRLERSIYQRNIYLYTMGSHLNVTFVNTRMITKMVSIITSRKN